MRTPIQLRLFLTTLAVLLLGMGLVAVLTWFAVEGLYLSTQRENLLAQAQLTAAAVQGYPLPIAPVEPYSQTTNIQPGIHTRLLGEQGAVVVNLPLDSDGEPVQVPLAENVPTVPPDELRQRPEIQSALQGIPDTAVRRVASAGNRKVLYAAAPIYADDATITGIVYLATPLPPASLPSNLILQLAGAVVVAVLLAGVAGVLLSRRISRPLEGLSHAASAVAKGDLDQQVPADSDIRELHALGQSFNHMTANLRQSDQAKNAFVADVTHELRTPLTVINGTIETLEDGALDDLEGRGPLLASMGRETSRLIRLVNDLLVLTRADAGALNLNIESLDLAELARSRCEQLTTLAAPRQVTLDVKAQGQTIARGDPDRLSQVLDNLLDNAIRHAPEGSTITVTVEDQGDEIRCSVSDRGPGIPAQHLPFIFERFYRVDTSRSRNTGGTGLGLAIVRSLVSAHSGRIAVDSAEGQGTTITFWLPTDENCHPTA
ncbi:MAG: ATP-binding protein [Anaerolineales bacterium]|jgi:heavy metal sensor kinase